MTARRITATIALVLAGALATAPGAAADLPFKGDASWICISGEFDGRTEDAVLDLQASEGLPETGEVADRTWGILLEGEPAEVRWSRRAAPRSARLAARRYEIPGAAQRSASSRSNTTPAPAR